MLLEIGYNAEVMSCYNRYCVMEPASVFQVICCGLILWCNVKVICVIIIVTCWDVCSPF